MFLLKKELSQSKGRKALLILNYRCNSHALSLQKRQMQGMLILRKKLAVFNINRVDIYGQNEELYSGIIPIMQFKYFTPILTLVIKRGSSKINEL
jgi:hypothetical protein